MRIVLVGADFEENLGIGMIAAVARAGGHLVEIVPFNDPAQLPDVSQEVVGLEPDLVGLSIQFQHRAHDFLTLARHLREAGFRGHVTCGGQFPTLAYREVLGRGHGVDSVVLHDGEITFVALLDALAGGRRLAEVPGLAIQLDDGAVTRTAPRSMPQDLDELPFPVRYRPHSLHMGVPFIPLMGSRGCWGSCSFCSITTYYRDARAYGGGKTIRHRSPDSIASEMALLAHAAGGTGVFCFHDDNFLLPQSDATVERVGAIRAALDSYGIGRVGMIGKCRPDSIDAGLARKLAELGVIRLYVGVENVSTAGAAHLNRSNQTAEVRQALQACRDAGIFGCYNLLLFEPDATLDDIEQNAAFIREHADHPVNFCRAEPYYGTPLQLTLAGRDNIGGSYLGFDYRIADDRVELLFRICAAAFRQRNFAADGVHNRYMGLGYNAKLLEYFHPERDGERDALVREARQLTRDIALETAELLEEALRLARHADLGARDAIERETALLGLRIAEADRYQHARLDMLYRAMHTFVRESRLPRAATRPTNALVRAAQRVAHGVALATLLSAWQTGCDDQKPVVVDPVPSDAGVDGMVADPLPADQGVESMVADPLPADQGVEGMVYDPLPADQGVEGVRFDGMVVDMVPSDAGVDSMVADPPPADQPTDEPPLARSQDGQRTPIDQWRDTSPKRSVRSDDLPLFDPPVCVLVAERDAERIKVTLRGGPRALSTRWESDGEVQGDGREVVWTPISDSDQLRVGVRSKGGVAVVALRAGDVG